MKVKSQRTCPSFDCVEKPPGKAKDLISFTSLRKIHRDTTTNRCTCSSHQGSKCFSGSSRGLRYCLRIALVWFFFIPGTELMSFIRLSKGLLQTICDLKKKKKKELEIWEPFPEQQRQLSGMCIWQEHWRHELKKPCKQ